MIPNSLLLLLLELSEATPRRSEEQIQPATEKHSHHDLPSWMGGSLVHLAYLVASLLFFLKVCSPPLNLAPACCPFHSASFPLHFPFCDAARGILLRWPLKCTRSPSYTPAQSSTIFLFIFNFSFPMLCFCSSAFSTHHDFAIDILPIMGGWRRKGFQCHHSHKIIKGEDKGGIDHHQTHTHTRARARDRLVTVLLHEGCMESFQFFHHARDQILPGQEGGAEVVGAISLHESRPRDHHDSCLVQQLGAVQEVWLLRKEDRERGFITTPGQVGTRVMRRNSLSNRPRKGEK